MVWVSGSYEFGIEINEGCMIEVMFYLCLLNCCNLVSAAYIQNARNKCLITRVIDIHSIAGFNQCNIYLIVHF